jgi:inosine/xanthosine triphosphatase
MKVAVGSKNPVKVRATENVFRKVFGKKIKILSVKIDSGVFHMPSSFEEIVKGAINRAKNALKTTKADFGVGLEGGYEKTKFGFFLSGAVAIVDKKGRIGIGGGGRILLPKKIVRELEKGKELGEIMDQIQKTKNTKQKWGAVGFLLKGYTNRQKSFEQAVLYALARFLRPEIYEK